MSGVQLARLAGKLPGVGAIGSNKLKFVGLRLKAEANGSWGSELFYYGQHKVRMAAFGTDVSDKRKGRHTAVQVSDASDARRKSYRGRCGEFLSRSHGHQC